MHPTVRVYWAGGVPEVMLHLRRLGLLDTGVVTATGAPLATVLDWWEDSRRRYECRRQLREVDGVDADRVIMPPEVARRLGVAPTITFVTGNLAPEGGIIKSTAIDPSVLDEAGVYRRRGPARVFTREADAVAAIKAGQIRAGDVLVLAGAGPSGTGMEETYQVTAALRYLSFGKHVTFLTDARFSGVSTGACIGHISPEALVGGPLGRLRDGDLIDIHIDTRRLTGSIDCVGTSDRPTDAAAGAALLAGRSLHPALAAHPDLPPATRLWAALQAVSGGPWRGSVYDVDRIVAALAAGAHALAALRPEED
jgi:dihydroxyacid dehydratase/phosphogluconate dehydratase